ncbi:hypothetical protein JQS43_09570 [Natronosporangium hydrolyticum]|uniref:ATPase BadF/BadG/BcrA/BcrD type domain-containing protein n=1 Tax=Natronosporangium hydrolyticum TaxID=2811111 RepID=A0A895YP54_9ACTN|nr:BadF/BadG/BcrA/BcrD ATPase family protein [Natronosporangium hydrolyticum]QSB16496.1 hypothetical protein JQS43_09570 [Natronosporangium hydrolyticum]
MPVLAVDAGRTHCRAAYFPTPDACDPESVVTVASEGTLADPAGASRVAARVVTALATLGRWPHETPSTLVVAAAGCLSRPAAAAGLAEQLAGALATPSRWGLGAGTDRLVVADIVVTSDVVAAHASAFAGAAGVVLAVGTGAVALAVAENGEHTVVDGAGYLFGDAGGGFWIGRSGLAAALRHGEGRAGGSAALAEAATASFAPPGGTLRDGVTALYGEADPTSRVARVASFAPAVAVATRGGDEVAAAIWRDAVAELAETAAAGCVVLPAEQRRVALVGSMFEVADLLTAPLRRRLAERVGDVEVRTGAGDGLAGAARLARRPVGGYDPLLRSCAVGAPADPDGAPALGLDVPGRAAAGTAESRREIG